MVARTPRTRAEKKVESEADQTPEEALVAKAEAEGTDIDQTPEEAQATAKIAEEDKTFKPVEEETKTIQILIDGFSIGGRVFLAGQKAEVSSVLFSQTDEDQIKAYGRVFFKKV